MEEKSSKEENLNTINEYDDKNYKKEENLKKINKISSKYKIHLFRKKVKELIKKDKQNYAIQTTLKEPKLKLVVFFPDDIVKEYPVEYVPILDQNIAYVSREDFKKRLAMKFNFVKENGESILDPKFNNEFKDGYFVNVLNLKKIIDKEEEREEDFQTFLETYFSSSNLSKELNDYFFKSAQNIRAERSKKRTLTAKTTLKLRYTKKINSTKNIIPILRERPEKRILSDTKKVKFKETEYIK